jgi:hypothetical protein
MIANNTAVNRGKRGNFLRVGGRVDGLTVANNLYVAPNLQPGSDLTAVIYVGQSDLSGITQMSGNIWPITKPLDYAAGGSFYLWPNWSDPRGYLKLDAWNRLTGGNDRQLNMTLDESGWPKPNDAAAEHVGARRE